MRTLFAALAALLFLFAGAAAQTPEATWSLWDLEAERAEAALARGAASSDALEQSRARLLAQIDAARIIAADAAEETRRLQAELDALGPPPEVGEEAADAAALRADLTQALAQARAREGRAERVVTRAENLRTRLAGLDQERFLSRIETLGPSPALPETWASSFAFIGATLNRIDGEVAAELNSPSMRKMAMQRLPLALVAVVAALFIAFGVRLFAVGALLRRAQTADRRQRRLIFGVGAAALRLTMLAAASALLFYGLSSTGLFGALGEATLTALARAVLTIIIAYAIAASLFSPKAAGLRPYDLDDGAARRGFAMAMLLGVSAALHVLVEQVGVAAKAPPAATAPISFVSIVLGGFALFQTAQIARPFVNRAVDGPDIAIGAQMLRFLRRTCVVVAVLAPLLALIGYDFAARYILFPTIYSLAALLVVAMVYFVIREAVENYLADQKKEGEDRLRLIPILAGFLLFCASVPMLALIWGASWADISLAYDRLVAGFRIGDVALSPMDFVTFALVFVIGYTLTRAAQRLLKNSVLPKTGMSVGGADALTSGIGYVGIFIAAIAAITAAGLDLSNLAIVAGALSVGIGFGLQNIVNNFVSGVILLVERPINVGDWIEVGGVHGTVKKVNVRSTEIETFDRASYIIPNSDLISGAVTNYTHGNTVGRAIVPVGVAYGTDTRLVQRILLEAASEHPMVLTSPAPAAYFQGFGADSLDFELRAYLRDVNWVLSVKSDLNFAIEEKLRAADVEIPFAQRDINIRNIGEVGRAIRRGGGDGTGAET
ncbi:MAG: mechanosensitive ion channel domain-containing protein [Pseudomonadota bacterium]